METPSAWDVSAIESPGAYQMVEKIGAGGMGEVYRAFPDDDQYRKEVAIKLVWTGQGSTFVMARFRNERQVFASLEHPNIARLQSPAENSLSGNVIVRITSCL